MVLKKIVRRSINKLIWFNNFSYNKGNLLNDCLINLKDIILIVPNQGAQDHKYGAGMFIEALHFSNLP